MIGLQDITGTILQWLLDTSIQGSVLIAAVLLLRLWPGTKLPTVFRSGLWLLVLLRLSLPVLPESRLSVYNLVPDPQSTATLAPLTIPTYPVTAVAEPIVAESRSDAATEAAPGATTTTGARHKIDPLTTITLLWLVGTLIVGGRAARQAISIRRLISRCTPITDAAILAMLDRSRREMNVRRRVTISECPDLSIPSLCGLWQPRLLLPVEIDRHLTPGQLRMVILHELAHLKRHDIARNIWLTILRAIFWFNPLMWIIPGLMRADNEAACDERVLGRLQRRERVDYGHALLQIAGDRPATRLLPSGAAMADSRRQLQSRIRMIAGFRRPGLIRIGAGIGLLAVVMLTFLTKAEGVMTQTDKNPPVKAGQVVLLTDIDSLFYDVIREVRQNHQPRSWAYTEMVAMRAAGWSEIDYGTLMTVSGFGPSFGYHHNEKFWVHYVMPTGALDRIAHATGYGMELLRIDDVEEYWQTLKKSIDVGKPVHSCHFEEILLVGYREDGVRENRRVHPLALPIFVKPGTWWTWKEFETWFREESNGVLLRHTERVDPLPPAASAREVMASIVELALDDPRDKQQWAGDAVWGLNGLETYARDVADLSKAPGFFHSGWHGCHNIYPQLTARQHTGRWLEEKSALFDGRTGEYMRQAASEYRKAHQAWLEYGRQLGDGSPEDAWGNDNCRTAGAKAIFDAIEHERTAVDLVQKALSVS